MTETTGAGRRVPDDVLWLFPPPPGDIEQQGALIDWARENGLDPARVIGTDGVAVDLVGRVIHYTERARPGDPGILPPTPGGVLKRRRAAPLLVEPPAVLRRPPVGWVRAASVHVQPGPAPAVLGKPIGWATLPAVAEQAAADRLAAMTEAIREEADRLDAHPGGMVSAAWVADGLRFIAEHARRWPSAGEGVHVSTTAPTPAAAYDWTRYERTCAPDRQLDGLGDLALFLGGSEDSFTGDLLRLIAKAQSTPDRFRALALGFPREVTAWLVWNQTSPIPTAAELCAAMVDNDTKRRRLRDLTGEYVPPRDAIDGPGW